jgi:hypothetical protein
VPMISVSSSDTDDATVAELPSSVSEIKHLAAGKRQVVRKGGLICGGCGNGIVGRIVSAIGVRWHPGCFQ